jgi:hypothetical protein
MVGARRVQHRGRTTRSILQAEFRIPLRLPDGETSYSHLQHGHPSLSLSHESSPKPWAKDLSTRGDARQGSTGTRISMKCSREGEL